MCLNEARIRREITFYNGKILFTLRQFYTFFYV